MPHQFLSVQYLRGVAALMVVLFHVGVQVNRNFNGISWPDWLTSGVDIFFVISGFVMCITTDGRSVSTTDFYWRRIIRIVPLYWLITSVSVLGMVFVPALIQSNRFNYYHVIASYLFVPAVHPVNHEILPVVIPGWTLNYEMYFYSLFGLLLFLPQRHRLWVMACFLGSIVMLATVLHSDNLFLQFYGHSIVLEFLLGMGLASALNNGRRLSSALARCSIAVGFIVLAVLGGLEEHLPHVLIGGVPSLAIVAGCVLLECIRPVRNVLPMRLLGDSSYSLYLSHGVVLSACGQVWPKLGVGRSASAMVLFVLFSVGMAVLVGLALYRYAERPLLLLLSGRRSRRPAPLRLSTHP
jgi:exopolysaccharide production protein ExoZ